MDNLLSQPFKISFMKTKLNKVSWLIISLLALSACKKNEDVIVTPPEQNKIAFIADNTGVIYAANAQTGSPIWTYATNGGSVYTSPAANKNVIVYLDQQLQSITCINVQTGKLVWNKTQINMAFHCSPIIVNDKVFIASYDNLQGKSILVGLNLSDGSKALEIPLYSTINALNYSNGLIIANTCGGHLYGIETSGNIKWEYLSSGSCYHTNPAIANKIIYIVSSGAQLSAVNITDGSEIWSTSIAGLTHDANVVFNNGMLFMPGDYTNKMFAFDAANGTLKHTYTLPADQTVYGYYHAPVIADGLICILSEEGILFAINVTDESIKWQKTFSIPANVEVRSSLTIANGVLFAGAGKYLYALDLNGTLKWQMATTGDIYNSPVVLSDKDKVYRTGAAGVVE